MKKVIEISANGEFKQYLLKSECRFISQMCEAWGTVSVKLVEISIAKYKSVFGK